MKTRGLQIALFILWPVIACLLMFSVAVICAVVWLVIPFGTPTIEGTSWTLKFPWSK